MDGAWRGKKYEKMTTNEKCAGKEANEAKKSRWTGGVWGGFGCAPPDEKVDSVRVEKLLGDHGVFCSGLVWRVVREGKAKCAPGTAAFGAAGSDAARREERIESRSGVEETISGARARERRDRARGEGDVDADVVRKRMRR